MNNKIIKENLELLSAKLSSVLMNTTMMTNDQNLIEQHIIILIHKETGVISNINNKMYAIDRTSKEVNLHLLIESKLSPTKGLEFVNIQIMDSSENSLSELALETLQLTLDKLKLAL